MRKLRFIAVFLLIASFLLIPAAPVFAAEAETVSEEVTRVREVESLRETDSETYLLSDGTYECVVFAGNKYYRDENDLLQPIDNTIVPADSSASPLTARYTNTANCFDVTFSGSGTPEVSIAYAGTGITFTPINATGAGNTHLTASASAIAIGAVRNCATLSQLTATGSNTATYTDAFGTADLVYVLENDALKEYIILESSASPNSFNFLFTLDGLTLQQTDTGTAFLNAEGEAVFNLGSLFAVDANGVPTDDLTYTFQTVKNNIIGITVTLDEAYLTAADRAFPVVIDPSVTISSSSTADACVCERYPNTNYYLAAQLRTGYDTDYETRRSYIRFNIPDAIEPGSVLGAYLDIEKISGVAPTMRAYRVTDSWSSSAITWSNKPDYTTLHQSSQSVPLSSGSSWYRMDVTAIVNAWVDGNYMNYGFVLVDSVEDDPDHWTTLYSSDADSPHKPELIISYSGQQIEPGIPSTATGAILLGVISPDDEHDHTSALQTISSKLSACGYTPVQLFGSSFSADNVNTYVASSAYSIFVSRSHGELNCSDEFFIDERTLYSTYLVLDETNSNLIYDSHTSLPADLSHMELMVFVGCSTGYRGEGANNLPTMAVAKGATTAIGFEDVILCDNANEWTKEFFGKLADGYSVSEACAELARDTYYQTGNLNLYVICGDGTLTIN